MAYTKTADSLGLPLTNIRTPVANELSAVHLERIKDAIIAIDARVPDTDTANVSSAGALVCATPGITSAANAGIGNTNVLIAGLVEGHFSIQITPNVDISDDGPIIPHWISIGDTTGITAQFCKANGDSINCAFSITVTRGLTPL